MRRMILVLMLLFSVYPTIVDVLSELRGSIWLGLSTVGMYGSQWGYSIVNFSLMYILGAYIRVFDRNNISNKRMSLLLILNTVLITAWAVINDKVGFIMEKSAWEYCNPLVICNAYLLFKIFSNVKIKNSSIINSISSASFMVFLIHEFILGFFNVKKFVNINPFVTMMHVCVCVIVTYLICWGINIIYEQSIGKMCNRLLSKIHCFNDDLYG